MSEESYAQALAGMRQRAEIAEANVERLARELRNECQLTLEMRAECSTFHASRRDLDAAEARIAELEDLSDTRLNMFNEEYRAHKKTLVRVAELEAHVEALIPLVPVPARQDKGPQWMQTQAGKHTAVVNSARRALDTKGGE